MTDQHFHNKLGCSVRSHLASWWKTLQNSETIDSV